MSRAFLMTLDRLAFMTVLVISRMINSKRLESTASSTGSNDIDASHPAPPSKSSPGDVAIQPPNRPRRQSRAGDALTFRRDRAIRH